MSLEPAKTLEHKYSSGVRANLLESVGTLLFGFFLSKEIGLREKKITLFSCSEIGINIVRFRELPGRFIPGSPYKGSASRKWSVCRHTSIFYTYFSNLDCYSKSIENPEDFKKMYSRE